MGEKEIRKNFSGIGLIYLAGAILVEVLQTLLILAVERWKPEWAEDSGIRLVLGVLPLYLVVIPLIVCGMRKLPEEKPLRRSMKGWQFLLAFVMCYALTYCMNFITVLITFLIGVVKGSAVDNSLIDVVANGNPIVNAVIMVLLAPVLEELTFRKLIVDRTVRYGEGVAILCSGIMFGLFHGNLNQATYATAMGMFMAFLYVKTGDIRVTIGIHMLLNFLGSVVAGFLFRMIDFPELMAAELSGSQQEIMAFFMDHAAGLLLFLCYGLFLIVMVITGIVLFIVSFRKFRVNPGQVQVPKGRRARTFLLNPGMLAYGIFWIGMILWQLLS